MRIALYAFVALGLASPVAAKGLRQIATIAIPGAPMKIFGAIAVDPAIDRGFLSDRSNRSVDVFDLKANKFLFRVGGFTGVGANGEVSGPQGLVAVNGGKQLWATDGDSTVKVIDLASRQLVAKISTGGKHRTGELAYDPRDKLVMATNPDETTQFVSLISTNPSHRIRAKIRFPRATEGIERSVWSPETDHFYVPLPSLDPARASGGIAEIDPRRGALVKIHATPGCNPHSVQIVGRLRLYIGCNFGHAGPDGPKGQLIAYDLASDRIVATGAGLGGDGQTAIDLTLGQYYAAANKNPGGPMLRVVNLVDLKSVQSIPTWNGSHSVALDSATHNIYLPASSASAPCGGCVVVYSPAP